MTLTITLAEFEEIIQGLEDQKSKIQTLIEKLNDLKLITAEAAILPDPPPDPGKRQ